MKCGGVIPGSELSFTDDIAHRLCCCPKIPGLPAPAPLTRIESYGVFNAVCACLAGVVVFFAGICYGEWLIAALAIPAGIGLGLLIAIITPGSE